MLKAFALIGQRFAKGLASRHCCPAMSIAVSNVVDAWQMDRTEGEGA